MGVAKQSPCRTGMHCKPTAAPTSESPTTLTDEQSTPHNHALSRTRPFANKAAEMELDVCLLPHGNTNMMKLTPSGHCASKRGAFAPCFVESEVRHGLATGSPDSDGRCKADHAVQASRGRCLHPGFGSTPMGPRDRKASSIDPDTPSAEIVNDMSKWHTLVLLRRE
jgi:hypothetical protein